MMSLPRAIFLMGPTASGKTTLAVELVKRYPCDIISVDSAMIYRGMSIGTAKPSSAILEIAPHRLIDIRDPVEAYSAGDFRLDALREMESIVKKGRIPLLVGGTMLYFKILQHGIADLPSANQTIRRNIAAQAEAIGWKALHAELKEKDFFAASRILPQDKQRIQRALEVYEISKIPLSTMQQKAVSPLMGYQIYPIILLPPDRSVLHARIEERYWQMIEEGFIEEVALLYARGDLSLDLPSIRAVGYRQAWEYLAGKYSFTEMSEKILAATRQVAKRQYTWLRSFKDAKTLFAPKIEEGDYSYFDEILR